MFRQENRHRALVSSFFFWIPLGLVLAPTSSALADLKPEEKAKAEIEFGIDVARRGLWKEAIYRWQKAVELDPENSSARNNLAVAYEQAGDFEMAEQEYKRALELDSSNMYIRQNYELFRESYEKKKRTDGRNQSN